MKKNTWWRVANERVAREKERYDFYRNLHTCPTRCSIRKEMRKRRHFNYGRPWSLSQDRQLLFLMNQGLTLKSICDSMGRNPNGIVLRTIALHVEPVFAGKRFEGKYYQKAKESENYRRITQIEDL